jgi:hypothetical protein
MVPTVKSAAGDSFAQAAPPWKAFVNHKSTWPDLIFFERANPGFPVPAKPSQAFNLTGPGEIAKSVCHEWSISCNLWCGAGDRSRCSRRRRKNASRPDGRSGGAAADRATSAASARPCAGHGCHHACGTSACRCRGGSSRTHSGPGGTRERAAAGCAARRKRTAVYACGDRARGRGARARHHRAAATHSGCHCAGPAA